VPHCMFHRQWISLHRTLRTKLALAKGLTWRARTGQIDQLVAQWAILFRCGKDTSAYYQCQYLYPGIDI
jgi:hypothetical protein